MSGAGTIEITGAVRLPSRVEEIELITDDGLTLVGELALPETAAPVATLVTLHPLPTAGGFMDSHILRKAAARLPALADLAVLRFNFRGVSSPRGRSEGEFGEGIDERADLAAALDFVAQRKLPAPWLLAWSFGTEVAVKWAGSSDLAGVILLSPPLHRASQRELAAWAHSTVPMTVLVPEFDDYLRPAEAAERFSVIPHAEVVGIEGAKHLWVGEQQTRRVLSEIVARIEPGVLPLPTEWRA